VPALGGEAGKESTEAVLARLAHRGNGVVDFARGSALLGLAEPFRNPLVRILAVAGGLCGILRERLDAFGYLILRAVSFLVRSVSVAIALHHASPDSLLVALGARPVPEFLPVSTSATLAPGAVHRATKRMAVKRRSDLLCLGSIDILCSDKTGPLTVGEWVFDASVDAARRRSSNPLFGKSRETGTPPSTPAVAMRSTATAASPAILIVNSLKNVLFRTSTPGTAASRRARSTALA